MAARDYTRERYRRIHSAAVLALGGSCVQCGFSDARALQFDHVTACGGAREQTLTICYEVLRRENVGAYRLLCANCNWIKRHESAEVPLRGASPREPHARKRGYRHKERVGNIVSRLLGSA